MCDRDVNGCSAHSYSPVLYTQLLLLSIVSFLNDPNPGCSDHKPTFTSAAELSSLYLRNFSAYQDMVRQHTLSEAVMTPPRLRQVLGKYSTSLAEEVACRVQEVGGEGDLLDRMDGPLQRLTWPMTIRYLKPTT